MKEGDRMTRGKLPPISIECVRAREDIQLGGGGGGVGGGMTGVDG